MKWVTTESVIEIHKIVIASTGGSPGIRSLGALESSLFSPLATFDGKDLYPGLLDKAAMLLYSISSNHPFVDGNKRTAFVISVTVLEDNGFKTHFTQDEVVLFMLKVAQDNADQTQIKEWLEKHMI
jgi:death on curing protein